MWYQSDNLNTKQDHIDLLKEILAYRELDGLDFDFGTGVIKNEMSYGSEDAYYEMAIESLQNTIDHWEYNNKHKHKQSKSTQRTRQDRRNFVEKEKQHLKKLSNIHWMLTYTHEDGRIERCYRGRESSRLKKVSNKTIRNYKGDLQKKGNYDRRIFDFWWELY